jgi:hypothetical protein
MAAVTFKAITGDPSTSEQLRFAAIEARVAQLEAVLQGGHTRQAASRPGIDPELLYKVQDVAEFLLCGKTTVYDLIGSGQLAVTLIGSGRKGMRVRGEDLIRFLDDRRAGGPGPRTKFKYLKNI